MMTTNVMFWLIPWAVVTTAVLVLLVWRLVAADNDTIRIAPEDPKAVEEEVQLAHKLKRLDLWGKALTVTSVMLLLVGGAISVYHTWIASSTATILGR
jgi:hypothetical protein